MNYFLSKILRISAKYEGNQNRPVSLLLLAILLMYSFPFHVLAQSEPDPLDRYLMIAAEQNPELRAKFLNYQATLKTVPQVGALPDPELAFGWFARPVETRVGAQEARISLTQMFPWFGTLADRQSVAMLKSKVAYEEAREFRNRLFYRVKMKWYELYEIEQTIRILDENISILESFESVALRQYEVAKASQIDVLRIQLDKEDLANRLALLKDDKQLAVQQFSELMNGLESGPAIPDSLRPDSLRLTKQELEIQVLSQNARLMKLDYRSEAAESEINLAQKQGRPDFGLGLDYIFTNERQQMLDDNGKDAVLARASIKVPLYRKKYKALNEQRELELNSIEEQQQSLRNQLLSSMEAGYRDYRDARRKLELYENLQIQRTRQAVDILVSAYATDTDVEFEEILRLQRRLLGYQLNLQQAVVQQSTAVAFLEYLYGRYNKIDEENDEN